MRVKNDVRQACPGKGCWGAWHVYNFEAYIMIVQETLRGYGKLSEIKRQVLDIYKRFPETVQDDRELWFRWLKEYQDIQVSDSYESVILKIRERKLNYESISRSGRYWRRYLPEDFKRGETIRKARIEQFRDEFGPQGVAQW